MVTKYLIFKMVKGLFKFLSSKGDWGCREIAPAYVIVPLFVLLFLFSTSTTQAAWYDGSWSYRKQITIDASMTPNTDQSYFPALIYKSTDADLAARAQADGDDILFTQSDGTTLLDHEIEKYVNGTGEVVVWVKIPLLSSSANTIIYMYYGNGSVGSQEDIPGTWDENGSNNFKGVWHLDEDTAGTGTAALYSDSTASASDGDDYISATGQEGKIDGGQEFDGNDDYVDLDTHIGNYASLSEGSISLWFKYSDTSDYKLFFSASCNSDDNSDLDIMYYQPDDVFMFGIREDGSSVVNCSFPANYADGSWHNYILNVDSSGNTHYIDGASITCNYTYGGNASTQAFFNSVSGLNTLRFGNREDFGGNQYHFGGNLDEIRISDVTRSPDWIKTSYNNQNAPASYLTFDAESDSCTEGVVTTTADSGAGSLRQCINYANSNPGTTISFNIPISDGGYQTAGADNWWRISPTSVLPTISANGTIIDGSTQTTNQGDTNSLGPEIEIYGASAGSVNGLVIMSNSNTINGLIINRFIGGSKAGILLTGASATGNNISDNYIGTNYAAASPLANYYGVHLIFDAANNTLSNNIIKTNSNYGVYINNSDGNTLSANTIDNNSAHGVYIGGTTNGSSGNLVTSNTISNSAWNGLKLSDAGSTANRIEANIFDSNSQRGIQITSGGNDTLIYHNTIHNSSAGNGIDISTGVTGTIISNNIITNSSNNGILDADSGASTIIDYNDFFGNTNNPCSFDCITATNNITTDPMYNNEPAGDFTLTECSSFAINNGIDLGGDQPDMNGASAGNYNSTAPDMGAFETTCSGSGSDLVIDNDFSDWCDGEGVEYCIDDEGGFNDWEIPNQEYDVTRFGVSTNRYDTFYLMFVFDEVSFGGGEKVTGCVLMDTTQPANNNIDLALCVDTSGDPSAIDAVTLYSCDDSIIGGCGNASVINSYGYGYDRTSNGPWDVDSMVEVALPFADLGIAGGDVVLTTLVTYPGNNFLKSPKDSIYETGGDQDYGQRIQIDTDDGTTVIIPGPGLQSVSGIVYTDEGNTPIGSGKTVRLVVNGVDAGSDATDASGGYYISAPIADNDKILVYIDGDATYKGTTVTAFIDPNLIGLDIYADHLIVRHDNAGSLTISDMNTAKGAFSDTDILYDLSGGNLVVNGSATELYIPTGHTFAPGDDIDGAHLEIVGTFTGGSNTYNLSGDFTNGGTFTPDSSFLVLDGTSQSISGSSTFYSLSKSVASADTLTFEADSTQTISNSLTLSGASGNLLSLRSSSSPSQWDLIINSVATKSIVYVDVKDSDASSSDASHKAINPTNSVNSGNNVDWFGNIFTWVGLGADDDFNTPANWSPAITPTANDICTINSTSNRQPSILTGAECGLLTLGNAASVMTLTFTGNKNLSITGDVTIGTNGFIAPSATPTGIFSIGGNWSDSIGTANVTSPASLHLNYNFMGTSKNISTDEILYDVDINGSVSLNSDLTVDNSLTINNGAELIHGNNTIYLNNTFSQNGTYTHDCNSLIEVNGLLGLGGNDHYPNIIINSGGTVTDANPSYADCDLTIQPGSTLTAANSLYVGGDWINNGGTVTNSGTIYMSGVAKEIGGTTATTFDSLIIGDGSGDSTTAIYDLTVNDTLTVTAGATFTLQADKNITIGNDALINGNLYLSGITTWSQEGKAGGFNSGIQVASGGLLSAQGTDSANRVSFIRLTPDYYDFVVNGGLDLNNVVINHTRSASNTTGLSIKTPPVETLNFDNVAIDLTEDQGGAVMLYWNTNRTLGASNISFDSATYLLADGDVNVEAKQGTINFTNYGGNYAGEANDFDNGGLANWLNGIGGTVYSDEGTTNIGAGKIIRLLINGVSIGTDTTDASGSYFISASPLAGDALLVYIDGDDGATTDGTTVTVSDGNNLSGLHVYTDHLIVRHDNGGSLTNSLISTAKGAYSDAEILASVTGINLTVSGSATELYIPAGHSFAPGGNVDALHLENVGTFTGGANSYNLSGDWSNSGTFTPGTSTVVFDGSTQSIYGSSNFYNLTKSVAVTDTFTFEAGQTTTVATGGTITLNGASGQLLSLVSGTPGTRWNFTLSSGTINSIDYVDVADSDASASDGTQIPVNPSNSTDSGNTIDWFPSEIVKKGYLSDGTALTSGTVLARGTTVKFLLYINNRGAAKTDISLEDILDGNFAYQDNTVKVDNSVAACAAATCTAIEETAIYNAVNVTAYLAEDDEDGSLVAGYNLAGTKVTAGDQGTGANAQLDIAASKVWAILFEVKIQ